MKNFIKEGDVTTLVAPYDVLSGAGMLVGAFFGVAQNDALSGAVVEVAIEGEFILAKVGAQAQALGAAIYWDNAAKNCTTTSAGNTKIGYVSVAALSADTTVQVVLRQ